MTPERMIHSQITIFKMQQMIQVTKTTLTEDKIQWILIDYNMKRFDVEYACSPKGPFSRDTKERFLSTCRPTLLSQLDGS